MTGLLSVGAAASGTTLVHPAGYAASFTLPATSDGSSGTIQATLTTQPPAGVPVPQASRRVAASIGAPLQPLVYVALTPSTNVTFANTPSFSFTLSNGVSVAAGSFVYVAYFDPAATSGWVTVLGPGSVNGQTLAFPAQTGTFTLKGGTTYLFALLSTQRPVSVYAIGNSGPVASASPSSLTLAGVGQGDAGQFVVSESNGTVPILGSFAFSPSTCAAYIFQNTAPAPSTNAITFTVWPPLPIVGTCTFTMKDQTSGDTIAVPITLPSAGPISVGGS